MTTLSLRTQFTALFAFTMLAVVGASGANYKPIVLDPTYDHDKWNTEPDDHIREFRAFTASFDGKDDGNGDGDELDDKDKWGVPEWVAYEIRKAPSSLGAAPNRPSPWIHDRNLFTDEICPDDSSYKHSNFSRGHMCMKSIAWRLGANADWNTHTTINAVPQLQSHNGKIWLNLEEKTKDWADKYGKIWVICGPIFDNQVPTKWIGDHDEKKVAVPDKFFKIVIREKNGPQDLIAMAFIQPHKKIDKVGDRYQHETYLRSINDVEAATGIDFLTSLPDNVEQALEGGKATALWSTEGIPEVVRDEGGEHATALIAARKAIEEARAHVDAFNREEPTSDVEGASGHKLKIVSVLPNPVGVDALSEAVTIRNDSNVAVDLSGYKLQDDDNTSWTLAGVLQPGATRIFVASERLGSLKLANNGDVVKLVSIADGRIMHEVRYGKARSGETFTF
jgi:endonuclease G, mitochondrial